MRRINFELKKYLRGVEDGASAWTRDTYHPPAPPAAIREKRSAREIAGNNRLTKKMENKIRKKKIY